MAHKKGAGSTKNGRDSNSKRLGVKKYGDHKFGATDPIRKIGRVGSDSGNQSLGLFNIGEGVSAAQELLFHPMFSRLRIYPCIATIPC